MKHPIFGRERRRPIALSAVGTVLVLVFACVLFTLTVLAIQPGLLTDTLAAFWEDKLLIPLNIFPVCVVLIVCYCLTGNAFSAAGIGGLIVNMLSYINLVKTDCRNDPFVPADCALLREAANAVGDYQLDLHWGTLAAILLLSAVCFALAYWSRHVSRDGMCAASWRWWCWLCLARAWSRCIRAGIFTTGAAWVP